MPQRISGDRVLLSTSEAMQASGLSREHIQRLLRKKQVEGVKLGHDWLVFEDALLAFLAQPRKPGPKGPHKKSAPRTHQDTPLANTNDNNSSDNTKPNASTK